MKVYTRSGDDGTTGLLFGGRVSKDSPITRACGAVDEAQATLGLARALTERGSELDTVLTGIERDLYVAMAELSTAQDNHHKLTDGTTKITDEMVSALEELIDAVTERFDPPTEFVIPGGTPVGAALDVARTVVRRAEREVVGIVEPGAAPARYLNRLSDALWTLARWQEGESLKARQPER
ncbi:MAG TPA: cob(I)yrinic acid a,c-diamide adenosyltransferase [Acidimicrobiales bacterium]|nr:cob(I)yrinic acid a,c-diamide adenosyltransferase [Acidimicrobiales bacterium]